MAQANNPYGAYERTNVTTADQRKLILMLYDGCIRNLRKGSAKIEAREMEAAHHYLVRSRQIVAELLATLRPEKAGDLGENLRNLYVYMFNRLVEANLNKDAEAVQEVERLLNTLREGWAGAQGARAQQPGGGDPKRSINVRS